jgi:hypothetical protein
MKINLTVIDMLDLRACHAHATGQISNVAYSGFCEVLNFLAGKNQLEDLMISRPPQTPPDDELQRAGSL